MSIILKNISGGSLEIADLGITIAVSGQRDLLENFTKAEISGSVDLYNAIDAADAIINDGSDDLNETDSLAAVTLESKYEDESNDPAGNGGWIVSATAPSSPSNGDGWYNTNDGIVYAWNGSKWLSIDTKTVHMDRSSFDNSYLNVGTLTNSDITGVILPRDATITGIVIKALSGNSNKGCSFEIDYNWLVDFYIVNYNYLNTSLDYDLDQGEFFQVYAWSTGTALNDVTATVEYKWRYSA